MSRAFSQVGAHFEDYTGNPYITMENTIKNGQGLLFDMGSRLSVTMSLVSQFEDKLLSEFKKTHDTTPGLLDLLAKLSSSTHFSEPYIDAVILPAHMLQQKLYGLPIPEYLRSQK